MSQTSGAYLKDGAIQLTYLAGSTTALLTVRGKDHDLDHTELTALADAFRSAAGRARRRALPGLQGRRGHLSGYLECHRAQGGPRVAMRLMGPEHVIAEVSALEHVSIGQVAGFPTAEQFERAGNEALERTALIRERDAEREARRAARRGTP